LGRAANLTPGAIDGVRRAAKDVAWMLTRRYGFADGKPSPALVSYVEKMNTATTIRTVVGYSRTLLEHDEQGTLESFADIPVLISCGENDAFTPASHSQALAEMLPHAELSLIPDSAHVALLERPEAVTAPLLAHIEKVLDALPPPPKKAVLTGRKRRLWPRRKRKGDELDGAAADS
ncbi:MAG: alpha/beta fold hydrolase, partial [Stackebrandtia sp.]